MQAAGQAAVQAAGQAASTGCSIVVLSVLASIFLTYEIEFVLILAKLENSVLPMG